MMGGCLGAAWEPAPGRIREAAQTARFKPQHHEARHRQAFARSSDRAGAFAGTRAHQTSPPGRLMVTSSGFRRRPPNHHEKGGRHDMNLGDFIDTFKDATSPLGGGVLPAPLPALGERRHAPHAAPLPPGGAGRRHQGRGPLPQGPPGHHGRRRDGHGQDLQCAA